MVGSSRSRGWPGIFVVAMLLPSASGWAADEPWARPLPEFGTLASSGASLTRQGLRMDRFEPPAADPRAAVPGANRFFRGHFMPSISRQFEEVVPIAPAPAENDFADSLRYTTVSEIARARAEHGTERAIRDYLLEVSTLERTYDAIKIRGRKASGGGSRGGVRIGVRISGGLPELEVRQRTGAGSLRLRADPRGSLGLEFKQIRQRYSRVYVGYDADDGEYSLGCRLSF